MTARERPIIFSAPMVRAILDGTKSQTRRIVKPQPTDAMWNTARKHLGGDTSTAVPDVHRHGGIGLRRGGGIGFFDPNIRCPFGQPGDRLWVREAWRFEGTDMMRLGRTHMTQDGVVSYLADNVRRTINTEWRNVETWMTRKPQSRPSIHMPRWASRITLEVTGIRVERLQDISDEDSLSEGVYPTSTGLYPGSPRAAFQKLWEQINGPGSWDANPWVWVVEFRRLP